jgi:quinol monooxygenase YgiN
MHIAIVNFQLKDMTHEQFSTKCDGLAAAFAAVPGLVSKVWLSDSASNTYGGVYTFRDRAAFHAFTQGDLARAVMTNPNFTDISVRDFGVLEGPTQITRGLPLVRAAS